MDVKAEIIVTASWPDGHPDDVDLYVEDPQGNIAWNYVKETGHIHLDRDDRGQLRDTIDVNGAAVETPLNRETVTVRRVMAGEYGVNAVRYSAGAPAPVPVTVKVEKINPSLVVLHYATVSLDQAGDERTVVRFRLDPAGDLVATEEGFKSLMAAPVKPRSRE